MATKRTVVEHYDAIKVLLGGGEVEGYTIEDALTFLNGRIEITQKKNASGKGGEPTEAQKKKMAVEAEIENAIVAVMTANTQYTPTDLVKAVNREDVPSTQKITPRLTALVADGKLTTAKVKGRTVYSLAVADTAEGATEDEG